MPQNARKKRAYILILPSLFTTGNLFCGFYSILHSFSHDFEKASYAILLAGVFDLLDGRVARMTRSTSEFGLEYDSIADVVSFGVAPAIMAYVWALPAFGKLGWAGAFFFAACGALRLARFNTISHELPKSYFLGLPIPAAANTVATGYIAWKDLAFEHFEPIVLGLTFLLGLLMVSSIRFRSFKDFDLKHKRSFVVLVFALIVITSIASRPEQALFLICFGYVIWGPLRELISFMRNPKSNRNFAPTLFTSEEEFKGENKR